MDFENNNLGFGMGFGNINGLWEKKKMISTKDILIGLT